MVVSSLPRSPENPKVAAKREAAMSAMAGREAEADHAKAVKQAAFDKQRKAVKEAGTAESERLGQGHYRDAC
jgi:hypothetical protein